MTDPVRILVVDPDDHDANKCIQALEDKGWMVDRAHRFVDASALIQKYFYNVVIMEIMLPDMLGTDGWRYFKSQRPEMACILTSGSASVREGVDAYDADILDFALKPLKMDAICNLIVQAIRHQRVAAAKLQREHEMGGLALWLSGVAKATTRREVFDTSIAHLEVILPVHWAAAFVTADCQLMWVSRSTGYLPTVEIWGPEQTTILEGVARQAMQSGRVITQLPSPETGVDWDQTGFGTLVVVPLVVENRNHGVLIFLKEQHEVELDQAEAEFSIVVGKILAVALDRVQLAKELRLALLPEPLAATPAGS